MIDSNRLIIFTRYPEPGLTKTRLIPVLGPQGASDLHCRMVQHTLNWAKHLTETRRVDLRIRFTGGNESLMAAQFGSQFSYEPQGEGDLGERLKCAFQESFQWGYRRVIAVGTDCPDLSGEIVQQAFDHLSEHDLTLGPAVDGGYYLIGLTRNIPPLFCDISWGTDRVLNQTLNAATQSKLSVGILPILADVDRPGDLQILDEAVSDFR